MKIDFSRWPINDDADSELRFWANELLAALGMGAGWALAAGLLIALLDRDAGQAGAQFLWDFWPYVVECVFWFGMLIGLLWGGSKRLGMGLAASLPWRPPQDEREGTARCFGQWAAFAASCGFVLWFTPQLAVAGELPGALGWQAAVAPVETACWLSALLFGLVALVLRRRRAQRPRRALH